MKEKPIKTPDTALQERLRALVRNFYEGDETSAVLAVFQEGQGLNILAQGSTENIGRALLQLIRQDEAIYRIAVDVVGSELARRVPQISSRKIAEGMFKNKPKS